MKIARAGQALRNRSEGFGGAALALVRGAEKRVSRGDSPLHSSGRRGWGAECALGAVRRWTPTRKKAAFARAVKMVRPKSCYCRWLAQRCAPA